MFEGTLTALVSPFREDALDLDGCAELVERQCAGGVDGLVVCGTTGEAPTLTPQEQDTILRFVIERVRDRLPVLCGTGTYSTRETVVRTQAAADAGADGALVVAPYYNKPGIRGMEQHFLQVAERSPIPIVLYNIPSRTGIRIPPELAESLRKHARIVGIKDAGGALADAMRWVEAGWSVLSGDDATTLPWIALGARGVISVVSNALPDEMSRLVRLCRAGDRDRALALHYRLLPLLNALALETNPGPIKALLEVAGLCTAEVRLPLAPASADTRAALQRAWDDLRQPAFERGRGATAR